MYKQVKEHVKLDVCFVLLGEELKWPHLNLVFISFPLLAVAYKHQCQRASSDSRVYYVLLVGHRVAPALSVLSR